MPYQDPETGETRFTLKDKQKWHNQMAKPGAKKKSKETGRPVKVTDFERGAHKAQADAIARKRYRYKMSKESKEGK